MPQVTIQQAIEMALEHHRAGRLREAEVIYRQVIAHAPQNADAVHLLGVLATQAGRNDLGVEYINAAIRLNPDVAEFHANLGELLRQMGQIDLAISHARRAIELKPDFAIAHANLGLALSDKGLMNEAIVEYEKAITLGPNDPGPYVNIGNAYWEKDRFEEALAMFRQAIAVKPDCADAHWSAARVLLQLGQLKEGWEEFEWRFKYLKMRLDRGFAQPQWDGSDLNGKTLLLHTEGGLGDAVNFIRFLPWVVERAPNIILECQAAVMPLFDVLPGIKSIHPRGSALPTFDCHIPFQSLPRLMGLTLENIPNKVPYLDPPRRYKEKWANRLPSDGKLKIGVVWCGTMYCELDFRSRSLDVFHPLLKIPDIHFVSLQKGDASKENPPEGTSWFDFTQEIHDFADTGALIQDLDLVISVDTSVAHLAASLAKPTWVLIPAQSDFRWLLNRTDSPWYPTMRLFRQPRNVPWPVIFEQVRQALVEHVANYNASRQA